MSTTSGVPIALQCGADWWIQFTATSDADGSAVAVTAPVMEIRQKRFGSASTAGTITYSSETSPPGIVITQPSPNVVHAAITAATTKNVLNVQNGVWDAYGTDPAGNRILLGSGAFQATPNVSAL